MLGIIQLMAVDLPSKEVGVFAAVLTTAVSLIVWLIKVYGPSRDKREDDRDLRHEAAIAAMTDKQDRQLEALRLTFESNFAAYREERDRREDGLRELNEQRVQDIVKILKSQSSVNRSDGDESGQ